VTDDEFKATVPSQGAKQQPTHQDETTVAEAHHHGHHSHSDGHRNFKGTSKWRNLNSEVAVVE
jgi:hypothetical protein